MTTERKWSDGIFLLLGRVQSGTRIYTNSSGIYRAGTGASQILISKVYPQHLPWEHLFMVCEQPDICTA